MILLPGLRPGQGSTAQRQRRASKRYQPATATQKSNVSSHIPRRQQHLCLRRGNIGPLASAIVHIASGMGHQEKTSFPLCAQGI